MQYPLLVQGNYGPAVRQLQHLLTQAGFPVPTTGNFGPITHAATQAFQAQRLDSRGRPLNPDGEVGDLTWWALLHPRPDGIAPELIDFTRPAPAGGHPLGRAALAVAQEEMRANAGETEGPDRGPAIRRYFAGTNVREGNDWCAAFVSYCFEVAARRMGVPMPFEYTTGARSVRNQFRREKWAYDHNTHDPQPGDIVVWWRQKEHTSWLGHIGIVYAFANGILYTIEGNKTSRVQGFDYVMSRYEARLLGFGRVGGVQ